MIKLIIIIICFIAFSCSKEEHKGFPYPSSEFIKDTSFYFPYKFLKNRDDSIILSSQSDYLRSKGQRNLSIRPLDNVTFRLTYIPSWSISEIITITKDYFIITKIYDDTTSTIIKPLAEMNSKWSRVISRTWILVNEKYKWNFRMAWWNRMDVRIEHKELLLLVYSGEQSGNFINLCKKTITICWQLVFWNNSNAR